MTYPRIFDPPSTWDRATEFADSVRSAPSAVLVAPGSRHWQIFTALGSRSNVRGNLVPDAYLAALALAIESGSEWITADRGFARYLGAWPAPAPSSSTLGTRSTPAAAICLDLTPDAQLTMGRGPAVQHPTGRRVHGQHMVGQATKADAHGNELSGGTGIVRPWPR